MHDCACVCVIRVYMNNAHYWKCDRQRCNTRLQGYFWFLVISAAARPCDCCNLRYKCIAIRMSRTTETRTHFYWDCICKVIISIIYAHICIWLIFIKVVEALLARWRSSGDGGCDFRTRFLYQRLSIYSHAEQGGNGYFLHIRA